MISYYFTGPLGLPHDNSKKERREMQREGEAKRERERRDPGGKRKYST